jgi:hypothetical protein
MVPAHIFWSVGQLTPHLTPSQVAVPPVGGGHSVQEPPQLL